MSHPESVTAAVTANEPADGSKLILNMGGGEWTVIVRDDAAARIWSEVENDRWFHDSSEDPMSLHEQIKNADAVYALGVQMAVFDR